MTPEKPPKTEVKKFTLDYEPEKFVKYFVENHAEEYKKSLETLQKLENLSELEAEKKLNSLLAKYTIIQRNLIVNGIQTDEQLYKSLKRCKDEQGPIFKSPSDVSEFCMEMRPIIMNLRNTNKFRNSHAGFRAFVQYLRVLLEKGEIIDDISINDALDEFEKEMKIPEKFTHESQRTWKRKEARMMIDWCFSLPVQAPGFLFDKETERISLDTSKVFLPLHLPIFEFSIDENNEWLADTSRFIRGKAEISEYLPKGETALGEIITPSCLSGVRIQVYGKQFPDESGDFDPEFWGKRLFQMITFEGVIMQSGEKAQVDVTELCYAEQPTTQTYATPKQYKIDNPPRGPSFSDLAMEEKKKIVYKKTPICFVDYNGPPDGYEGVQVKEKEEMDEFDFDHSLE